MFACMHIHTCTHTTDTYQVLYLVSPQPLTRLTTSGPSRSNAAPPRPQHAQRPLLAVSSSYTTSSTLHGLAISVRLGGGGAGGGEARGRAKGYGRRGKREWGSLCAQQVMHFGVGVPGASWPRVAPSHPAALKPLRDHRFPRRDI